MEFHTRSAAMPKSLAILAGGFNPPTLAHRELVLAASLHVDEVLCVLPRAFPHKDYFGATVDQRLDMLARSELPQSVSIATTGRALFIDIAHECREHYGMSPNLYFLCGADAAERVLSWDYGRPGVVEEMLENFELLVASRNRRALSPPAQHAGRVHALQLSDDFHNVSSTEVRERIKMGLAWEHLVPARIVETVRAIYS